MEIRLASVPRDSGHIFPRPLEAIQKLDYSSEMDVNISRERSASDCCLQVRSAMYLQREIRVIRLPGLLNKGELR